MEGTMTAEIKEPKQRKHYFSWPLFKQSIKANWVLWLVLTLASALLFVIINVVLGARGVFSSINMARVQRYVADEDMQWLQILGLLNEMGFSLNKIQVMSQIDLNSLMNDLAFKIAGVLLPMIFVMICANKLISAQVTNGSMAYILSTPTNRKKVVRTQLFFLFAAIFAMYIVIFIGNTISEICAYAGAGKMQEYFDKCHFARTAIFCLGSFCAMICLGGICFGASAFFNKSRYSLAIGCGVCVLSFLCCILGLFGSKIFVSVGIGVEAMNVFNYMTVFSLINTDSISEFVKSLYGQGDQSLTWVWQFIILVLIGSVFSVFGSIWFTKKDLPL